MLKFSFANTHAIVTGGASGIGLEITKSFLQAGAHVTIWDYSAEALKMAEQELSQFSKSLKTMAVDVSSFESCQKAAASSAPVDVLINNAGITRDKSFAKMGPSEWDAVINTNLSGLFYVTKSLQEKFNPNSTNKRIINISSVVGLYGNFGQTNYAAAKAGVIGMTKTLAKELGRKGYTVNAVAPGFISTPMTDKMPPEVLKQIVDRVPVARMGRTEDIANACLFLSSPAASYINGAVLSVDGGTSL
ncbi:MAG: beta-ketoacyl-ACP reductase [Bdellovibrionales bacterium]|nr:beta-ketoacyl-ACP reductase [Bdellovibrionales bacterium]